ncbi:MAG: carboxypeptidase M32 [Ferruginibacter sp.]|nr:carboxypeptidase M32 [Ferruginibacter sp.]
MPYTYSQYLKYINKVADIKFASALLQWDQETYLPPKGNYFRAQQLATLDETAHSLFTNKKFGSLLNSLLSSSSLTTHQKKNIEISLYDYQKAKKLTPAFVRKMSEVINHSFHAWIKARKENDFSPFEKPLQEIINLKRIEADSLGYSSHPYDALINNYDKGVTTEKINNLFDTLQPKLKSLINEIAEHPQVDNSFLKRFYSKEKQWQLGIELLKRIHFDFDAGRQDISEHPFTTSFNTQDVRLTTRIDENDLENMVWSCLHEGGHGLYEQGLPSEEYGLPQGEYCSISIHESQSRLWENCVGRSLSFWQANYPLIQNYFPETFSNISSLDFFKAINKVQPSLIRTEADELTYHLHIMIRFELEKDLIMGTLKAKDIPARWNELYKKHLRINVPNDNLGCLQDVHWSHGSFGYFATYSLGSLYAAQFFNVIEKSSDNFNLADTHPVLTWLQSNIYAHGRSLTSEEICKKATGESLNINYFLEYAHKKFQMVYN